MRGSLSYKEIKNRAKAARFTYDDSTRPVRFTRWGVENLVGEFVLCTSGRRRLGEVVAMEYDPHRGVYELTVKHFNGELWSIKPIASAIRVIPQAAPTQP